MGISLKPYIGSRDFFPDEMEFRNWMFNIQRQVCRKFGYSEYAAPILEPVDLYRMKSSDEIVSEQLYRFEDRGDREVAIRPEMTPTLARMACSRLKELPRPLRWFSIANFMRYERPGRGRLREFYQLNVDHLGTDGVAADVEILLLSIDILESYGADSSHFKVRYSDRRLLDSYLVGVDPEKKRAVSRILDKKEKISEEEFSAALAEEVPDEATQNRIRDYLTLTPESLAKVESPGPEFDDARNTILEIERLCGAQGKGGYLNFDPAIVRGFDYYTGFIFEIFDESPDNRRSIFGGGRYDKLIGLFGKEQVSAVGFGLGDVTLENFVRAHNLVKTDESGAGVYMTLFSAELLADNLRVAGILRDAGIDVEMAITPTKKLGKQFELADKKGRRLALVQGPEEVENNQVRIKNLKNGEQEDLSHDEMVKRIKELLI